jgi:hypothetical protein
MLKHRLVVVNKTKVVTRRKVTFTSPVKRKRHH